MTKQSAWMPIYIGDYLGDTQRLTTEQHGAYLLLLMDYWREGPPPADDAVLAQITRLPLERWQAMKKTILRYFKEVDGELVHGRVEAEKAKAEANQERRSEKAKKAAQARWGQCPKDAPSIAKGNAPECPPPSPSSVSNDTGGEPPNIAKMIFDMGVEEITALGKDKAQARSIIGKWRKQASDATILESLLLCREKPVGNIIEWMTKRLAAKPKTFLQAMQEAQERTAA